MGSLYRESADILASLEKPSRVSSTITSVSDLSSPLRTSSHGASNISVLTTKINDVTASCTTVSKPPSTISTPPNDLMGASAAESEEEMITNSTTNPPPFDFLSC